MKRIKVGDLMTDEVVSVVPVTSFKEVAKLLAQHNISGLPVLDDEDRVVGIVSESDLLNRQAARHLVTGDFPDAAVGTAVSSGAEFTAAEVMSTPAVTVHADETAPDAARLMMRSGVERLPVVDDEDRLVGIVTRRDLLRVFLRPDAEIRRRLVEDVLVGTMGLRADVVTVHAVDGVVTLEGRLESQSQIAVLTFLAEQLDGVVAVVSHVSAPVDGPVSASSQWTEHGLSAEP
ncbi:MULTISPECIES: CBS domain-containing protein [unclassified Streptomyces]|uniref:CBS domain-containing protein n=1 Tax=unclassified Streptomyces TaxID=2593676 RepID=UPI0022502573|nr:MULTISPECIES: CBS domain-containing protein [unclassified Streptomyces]WSP53550.1 CBS domain-containing protein [Streptomyces sp. NBC_01241]WSU25782.1 CBS domain-containing protein [Streptomyces sp. NBC_01108]MCX4799113.1 CBS domain-containing protein [Streptomyces sp. NBC_01242]WSJ40310.1 CBS domain-containing protein [Streptomyces sp. NBC_01321]WSP66614.1 CBS domain-containing protein [Streptomyces sp. NBC_01240]